MKMTEQEMIERSKKMVKHYIGDDHPLIRLAGSEFHIVAERDEVEELALWFVEREQKHIDALSALKQKLDAVTALAVERRQFILNSVEMGFIRLPDESTNDPATATHQRCLLESCAAGESLLNALRAEGAPVIQDRDLKALRRFNETSEDGQGYDIGDEAMDRLVEIGLVTKERGKIRVVTTFGLWVLLGPSNDVLPILTTQRDRDIAFNERIAQLRNVDRVAKDGE